MRSLHPLPSFTSPQFPIQALPNEKPVALSQSPGFLQRLKFILIY